jgi:hypothetical protein
VIKKFGKGGYPEGGRPNAHQTKVKVIKFITLVQFFIGPEKILPKIFGIK